MSWQTPGRRTNAIIGGRVSRGDKRTKKPATAAPLLPRRRRLFAAVTMVVVCTMLTIIEIALRLFHFGSEYDLVASTVEKGKQYYYLNPSVGKRYFDPVEYSLPKIEYTAFEVSKSPETFRIFCLGASTTAGFPYSYNLSPSFLLKKQLEAALPGKRIEVVNAGLTATCSYTVVEFARELANYQPDVFVIYTGQNEFYGALGVGSTIYIGQYRWLTEIYLTLRRLKTFVLFEESVTAMSHLMFDQERTALSGTLMEQMAKDKAIPFDSPMYRRTMDVYKKNLEDVLDIARSHGIPVVLSTLVTNERSLQPFVSIHTDGLGDGQKKKVEALITYGGQLQNRADYAGAMAEYRKAVSIDPVYAITQFRLGQCYEQTQVIDSARVAFATARDLDGLRFRASAEENRIVRSIARSANAVIADVDSAFRAHSPFGIPGEGLLWEHVHPTLDGYFLLSETWFKALASIPFASADVRERLQTPVADSVLRVAVGSTALDAEFAAQTMEKLLHRWPFESGTAQRVALPQNDIQRIALPQNDIQRVASLFINGTLRWNEAHYELADAYLKNRNIVEAVKEYEAVNAYYPDDPFPLVRMGDMYALLGKNEAAISVLLRVLDGAETQFIHLKLGVIYAKSDAPERALEHLSRAFELDSQSGNRFSQQQFEEGTYWYSFALYNIGKTEDAQQTLTLLLQNNPTHPKARQLLSEINKRKR